MATSWQRPTTLRADSGKIQDYLLNSAHPDGKTKAKYFKSYGFSNDHPDALATALFEHPLGLSPTRKITTRYGDHFVFEGPIPAPNGFRPLVRSVWEQKSGEDVLRLVTAYPLELP